MSSTFQLRSSALMEISVFYVYYQQRHNFLRYSYFLLSILKEVVVLTVELLHANYFCVLLSGHRGTM